MIITKQEVVVFKGVYCNENNIVARLLRDQFAKKLSEPILDVGAGPGDISASAFPEKRVIHLDVLDYSNHPIPQHHTRERADFFDYSPGDLKLGSVVFCHVLQFLDDDVGRLNEKLNLLSPDNVVTVLNVNDDFMSDLIKWFADNAKGANPEADIAGFPNGYALEEEASFTAKLACRDYETLSDQVCFLMDCDISGEPRRALRRHLEHQLDVPAFSINEKISLYQRRKA